MKTNKQTNNAECKSTKINEPKFGEVKVVEALSIKELHQSRGGQAGSKTKNDSQCLMCGVLERKH